MQSFNQKRYRKLVIVSNILRLLSPPFIFVTVVITTIFNFLHDVIDGELYKRAGYARSTYSIYDKILDYYWYLFILWYIWIHPVPNKMIFIVLFLYRTIGQLLYLVDERDAYLFFFPNLFELFFFVYVLSLQWPQLTNLFYATPLVIMFIILVPIALLREYTIHIQRANFSWIMNSHRTHWVDEDQ